MRKLTLSCCSPRFTRPASQAAISRVSAQLPHFQRETTPPSQPSLTLFSNHAHVPPSLRQLCPNTPAQMRLFAGEQLCLLGGWLPPLPTVTCHALAPVWAYLTSRSVTQPMGMSGTRLDVSRIVGMCRDCTCSHPTLAECFHLSHVPNSRSHRSASNMGRSRAHSDKEGGWIQQKRPQVCGETAWNQEARRRTCARWQHHHSPAWDGRSSWIQRERGPCSAASPRRSTRCCCLCPFTRSSASWTESRKRSLSLHVQKATEFSHVESLQHAEGLFLKHS